jgi:AmiR/NasT family two-component response regulator
VQSTAYGAMNLYSRESRAFTHADLQRASQFASHAAILLANVGLLWEAQSLSEGLAAAMEHRAIIEQAKGIIMATMRCDSDRAFEQLVQQSQHENRKLREVAQGIVAQASRRP